MTDTHDDNYNYENDLKSKCNNIFFYIYTI